MIERCTRPAHPYFADYGGRGITVCDRWRGAGGFVRFLADLGERPTREHTLDRIDVDGPYAPGNVRWATKRQQRWNRRDMRERAEPSPGSDGPRCGSQEQSPSASIPF